MQGNGLIGAPEAVKPPIPQGGGISIQRLDTNAKIRKAVEDAKVGKSPS